ncbi:MAG: GntR family transcriptional regulator [Rubrivivax sp.]
MVKRAYQHKDSDGLVAGSSPALGRTLIEDAYVQLRDDVVEGRLAPGEKLRIEHLKGRYGVGSATLREAITRLASDALVISEGQRGFWVAPISVTDLDDLTRMRMHIEVDALRQSIRRADAGWRERVRDAYQQMTAVEQPVIPAQRKQWEALNARFHEALVSGCDSVWTLRILRVLSRQSERYRHLAIHLPNSGRDVHAEHALIFDAAMSGAEARAALALEMHIRATPDLISRALLGGELMGQLRALTPVRPGDTQPESPPATDSVAPVM